MSFNITPRIPDSRSQGDLRRMIERKDADKKPREPYSQRGSEARRAAESRTTFLFRGCSHCGSVKLHDFKLCPANKAKCTKCDMNGHSAMTCFSKKRVKEKIQRDREAQNRSNNCKKLIVHKTDRSESITANERRKSRIMIVTTLPPKRRNGGEQRITQQIPT